MRRLLLALTAACLAVAPALAEETAYAPNLVTEQVWFECGAEKVENADDNIATWGTEAPTDSVTSGAGCGTIDLPFMQTDPGNIYDASWRGYFTGNLDTLTAEVHNIYVGPGRALGAMNLTVKLFVDGEPLFGELGEEITVTPVRSATGLSESVTFSIAGIGFVSELENEEHEVSLVLHGGTTQNRGPTVTDTVSGWVWDTTEVPSGIIFNPKTLADVVATGERL